MKFTLAAGSMAAVIASAASADITITLTGQTFTGFNFSQFVDYTTTNIVGTLTGASINVTLDASTNFTYADDLCVYVDIEPLSTAGKLQIGGFSNLNATQRLSWPNGGSSAPGTTSIGSVNLTTALAFTGDKAVDGTVWIGNGYGAAGTSGTWTGTVTLIGVNAVPVPAPGAMALLGVAGLAARRRRR
jgi:MYXO-CTERM domain-containing protein